MSEKDDGGPAFPMAGEPGIEFDRGMSLRDWFAGQALGGNLANPEMLWLDGDPNELAGYCYGLADAMLNARSGK